MQADPAEPPPLHPDPRSPGRRAFLVGAGAAVVVGAGAGVACGFAWHKPEPAPPPPVPADLVAAIAAEAVLLATIDAITEPGESKLLAAVRADHVAHEAALRALVPKGSAPYEVPKPAPAATSRHELVGRERSASTQAARRAAAASGTLAVLLASISACEAGHVELLS
jgi:hypothetical protein